MFEIKRLSKYYHINVNLNDKVSLYSLSDVKLFINNLKISKDINTSLESIKDVDIKNKVIDLINNNYLDNVDDIYIEIIINLLKNNYKDIKRYNQSINIIDIDDIIDNKGYYYILNFNQGSIPKVYHDDDLISDIDKIKLGLNTSLDKVLNYKNKIISILNNYENIIITYKLKDYYNSYDKSPLINELNLTVNKANIKYNYSNNLNKLFLGMKLDDYMKFNIVDNTLMDLYTTYNNDDYLKYDNTFKGVDYNILKKYLNNAVNISYSSMNNYFHCSFKYYIENILKLNIFEDTFYTLIGNLYHFVLSHMYDDDFNIKERYDEFLNDKVLSNKEKYFINNLYSELESIINVIKYQDSKGNLNNNLTEYNINIDKSNDLKITFKGFIDKIKYKVIDGIKYVSIIDYKTGSVDASLDNINYGFNMQLPVYVYLIKNENKDSKIIGFYIQKILNNKKIESDNLENDLRNNLKLVGYTIDNENLIKEFDSTYENSDIIKSMKITSKGFSSYTKLVNEEIIDNIVNIVDDHINEVISAIKLGKFEINPKRFDNNLVGCQYCKYRDLCYKQERDIKDLKYVKADDILRSEENGMD